MSWGEKKPTKGTVNAVALANNSVAPDSRRFSWATRGKNNFDNNRQSLEMAGSIYNAKYGRRTIATFDDLFSRFGFPVHLVTDNYSTFVGQSFQKFIARAGIRHSTTTTYFPATNGAAENFVDTIKRKTKCLMKDGFTLNVALRKFLFDYRNTPHAATGKTPASLFLGRELRTHVSVAAACNRRAYNRTPRTHDEKYRKVAHSKVYGWGHSDGSEIPRGRETWTPGRITKELTPGCMYEVDINEKGEFENVMLIRLSSEGRMVARHRRIC